MCSNPDPGRWPGVFSSVRFTLVALLVVAACGAGAISWKAYRVDREKRADLLAQGRLVAEAIDLRLVAELTGSPADLGTLAYSRLVEHLSLLRRTSRELRFIYLAGMSADGAVIFLVDSEPPGSEAHSPPGQVYGEAPEALKAVFTTSQAAVAGPVSDRGGAWVIAALPVMAPGPEEVLAALGLDVDAGGWYLEIARRCLPTAALALLFLCAVGFFAALLRGSESARRQVAASEARLSASEQRYRLAAENTGQLVYDVHLESGRILWSGAVEAVTGHSPEEFAAVDSRGWMDRLHPADRERTMAVRAQALATGGAFVAEYRFRRKDGGFAVIAERGSFTAEPGRPGARLVGVMEDVTGRRRAEKALRESEEKYRLLAESTHDAILLHDMEGRILYLNQAGLKLMGVEESAAVGRPITDFLPPDQLNALALRRARRDAGDGGTRFFETELEDRGGRRIPLEVSSTPVTRGGPAREILVVARDVTERREAERSLRESEERYRRIFETAHEGIWVVDEDAKTTFVNSRMAEILGLANGEMIGRNPAEFMVESELSWHQVQVETRKEGVAGAYERRFTRKDGSTCTLQVSASPLTDPQGRFKGAFGFCTDITERRRAEESLRENEARFRTLVDNIPQRVVLKDLGSRFLSLNRAVEELWGKPAAEIVGKTDHDLFPQEIADRHVREDREVIETGEVREFFEEEVLDGRKRHVHRVKVPIRDGSGTVTGVLVTVNDFTERVALEEQFRHAQKMEAVGRLAGGVAHDFNNLLTVIGGYAGMCLALAGRGGPLHENLLEIQTAAERAGRLTRQLLAFSRRQVMSLSVVDLNAVVGEMKNMLGRLLGEDVRVTELLSMDLGRVKADAGQIEQVITNLAVNARDAMPEGGRLVIATANLDVSEGGRPPVAGLKPGRYVRLSVGDSGQGMSAEVAARVFEPFFTTKASGKGTGLGLSTVFGIVKQSGGEIRVQSEPGKGTTFTVYLPRVDEAGPGADKKAVARAAAGTETVLIVEDEKALGRLAAKMLRLKGYQVLEADGADEALRVFSRHPGPIDLVLTDVVMPDGRGPALVERLRQVRPDFAVLYMSGYADSEITKVGQLRNGDNFIQKPFTTQGLTEQVRDVLDRANSDAVRVSSQPTRGVITPVRRVRCARD